MSTRLEAYDTEGYHGSATRLWGCPGTLRCRQPHPSSFFPLKFDPGQDAQVDWGEAIAGIAATCPRALAALAKPCCGVERGLRLDALRGLALATQQIDHPLEVGLGLWG